LSSARRKLSEKFGEPYVELASLGDAKQFSDGVVIFEREGEVVLVARAQAVRCSAQELDTLANELDAQISFERQPVNAPLFGSDGARVDMQPWVAPSLDAFALRKRLA
jgi:hypothetical protein